MSILNQIPKSSFIFDPTMANESRGVLSQVRRLENETGQSSPAFTRNSSKWVVNKAGILVEVPENVPAVEFDKGFSKGYLAEPGGTTYVNAFDPEISQLGTGDDISITKSIGKVLGKEVNIINCVKTQTNGNRGPFFPTPTLMPSNEIVEPSIFMRINSYGGGDRLTLRDSSSESNGRIDILLDQAPIGVWFRVEKGSQAYNLITQYNTDDKLNSNIWFRADTNSLVYDIDFAIPQMEVGSISTSPIIDDSSTASRGADSLIFENAEDLIGQESGVILLRSAWLSNAEGTSSGCGFKLGTPTASARGISVGINEDGIIRVTSRNEETIPQSNIDSNYTVGEERTILLVYDYQGQDPNTTVIDGMGVYMGGIKIGEFNLAVPDTGRELNRILLQGAVGGPDPNDAQGVNKRDEFIYLWNNADWLTDELAERLTS